MESLNICPAVRHFPYSPSVLLACLVISLTDFLVPHQVNPSKVAFPGVPESRHMEHTLSVPSPVYQFWDPRKRRFPGMQDTQYHAKVSAREILVTLTAFEGT